MCYDEAEPTLLFNRSMFIIITAQPFKFPKSELGKSQESQYGTHSSSDSKQLIRHEAKHFTNQNDSLKQYDKTYLIYII